MAAINLKDFYPWYTHDEFVDVPEEIAEELFAHRRQEKSQKQRARRNKSFYSIDLNDGIESYASFTAMTPHEVLEYKYLFCRLCRALNSLPDIQGRRVEAHFILGMSIKEIAEMDGITKGSVSISITRGLKAMKKYLRIFE